MSLNTLFICSTQCDLLEKNGKLHFFLMPMKYWWNMCLAFCSSKFTPHTDVWLKKYIYKSHWSALQQLSYLSSHYKIFSSSLLQSPLALSFTWIKLMFQTRKDLVIYSRLELGLFGTLKLALALQFIVTNAYFSVAQMLTLVLHATLK